MSAGNYGTRLATRNFEVGDLVMRVYAGKTVSHPDEAGVVLKRFVKAGKVLRCLVQWNSGRTVPIKASSLKSVERNSENDSKPDNLHLSPT